jgi:hypothetical protein
MDFDVVTIDVDGKERAIALSGERSLIGSGPNVDLRLERAGIALEHLVLEPREEGCRVVVLADASPVIAAGASYDDVVVAWGGEITVAGARVRLDRRSRARRRSSPVILAAPIVVGASLWMIFSADDGDGLMHAPSAPAIFDDTPVRCESGRSPAHHRAERDERAGDAHRERYPFAPHDGVRAVALYRRAEACYTASGDGEGAQRAARQSARLRARVDADYDTARFRLERALTYRDWASASVEARTLLDALEGRDGPYVEWLTVLERRLRFLSPEEAR